MAMREGARRVAAYCSPAKESGFGNQESAGARSRLSFRPRSAVIRTALLTSPLFERGDQAIHHPAQFGAVVHQARRTRLRRQAKTNSQFELRLKFCLRAEGNDQMIDEVARPPAAPTFRNVRRDRDRSFLQLGRKAVTLNGRHRIGQRIDAFDKRHTPLPHKEVTKRFDWHVEVRCMSHTLRKHWGSSTSTSQNSQFLRDLSLSEIAVSATLVAPDTWARPQLAPVRLFA